MLAFRQPPLRCRYDSRFAIRYFAAPRHAASAAAADATTARFIFSMLADASRRLQILMPALSAASV